MSDQQDIIDRMVDGELDRGAERELLIACEAENRWREVALAFLEARAFKQEMQAWLSDPDQSPVAAAATTKVANVDRVPSVSVTSRRRHWVPWSVAIAMLLSLGMGYGLGWGWRQRAADPMIVERSPQQATPHSGFPQSLQIMVNHPTTQELQQVEIPILQAKDLGPDWQHQLQRSSWDELIDEVRRQGLNVQQQRTLTPIRLSNGQRVVIPVDFFYEQPYQ